MWEWITAGSFLFMGLSWVGVFVAITRFRNNLSTVLSQLLIEEISKQDSRLQRRMERQSQQASNAESTQSQQSSEESTVQLPKDLKMRPGMPLESYLRNLS